MALLERVATLLRANVNDLLDRAEDPEKMMKQLLLDMENQLLQVKTQVAIALADGHRLEKKRAEHEEAGRGWTGKAEAAVARGNDRMAKDALDRSLTEWRAVDAFKQQVDDQAAQTEALRGSYLRLQRKLAETRTQCATLAAAHRRSRGAVASLRAAEPMGTGTLRRVADRVDAEAAMGTAQAMLNEPALEEQFDQMEREEQVEALLLQLKQKALTA